MKKLIISVASLLLVLGFVFFSGWEYLESFNYDYDYNNSKERVENLTVMVSIFPKYTKGKSEKLCLFNAITHYRGHHENLELHVNLDPNVFIKMKDYTKPFKFPKEPVSVSNLVVKNEKGEEFVLIGDEKQLVKSHPPIRLKGFSGERLEVRSTIHYLDPHGKEQHKIINLGFTYAPEKKVQHQITRWLRGAS